MTSSSSGSISSSFQCSGNLPLAQLRKCFQSEDRWFIQILLKFFPTCGEIFGTAKVISVTLVWKKTLRYYTARFWEQTNHHPEIQMIILIFVFHFCKKTEKKKKITPNFSRQTYHGMEATVEANRCKLNQPSHHCWSFCCCDSRFLSFWNHGVGQHPVCQQVSWGIYNIQATGGNGKTKMMLTRNACIAWHIL